ncbi:MAG: TAT-variant-translocated molybdopterin oxidoreductase, partial [Armatimonadota bacterium]
MHNEPANHTVKKPIWKSWAERAGTEEARRWAEDEFPDREGLLDLDRRDFIKLAGAGMALAGGAGCRQIINADPKSVPYVRAPEGMIPGVSVVYATAVSLGGYATGVVVESHEGRPSKIEGNPLHPASLGSTDVFTQAEILNLYDPERSQSVIERGEVSSWESFLAAIRPVLKAQAAKGGSGIRVLSETVSSPAYAAIAKRFAKRFPAARWAQYEPISRANVFTGTKTAFGEPLQPVYDLAKADVIVALDADLLAGMPGAVAHSRAFADRRRVRKGAAAMNRLYAIESAYTLTGAAADHRAAVKPSEIEAVARALRSRVAGLQATAPASVDAKLFDALVADIKAAGKGRAVVVPGDQVDATVHALAHAINSELGAIGSTVAYIDPIETDPTSGVGVLKNVVADLGAGSVDLLVILGGNPVYNAPADLGFGAALEKAKLVVRLGLYEDETSAVSHWHLPEAHALEAWGDARAFDGTVSIVQPLTAPLYRGKSAIEVVSELLDQ